jgi:hypothetical protein
MRTAIVCPCLLATSAVLLGAVPVKPCDTSAGAAAETLLTRAQVARRIAGTQSVELDASRSCINVAVRTPGTARLVELLFRGLEVPPEAVRFQVDSSAIPGEAARRT